MIDDNKPHNCGNTDIDEIAQWKVKTGFKIFNNQRDKLKVEKIDHQPFDQLVLTHRLRRKLSERVTKTLRFVPVTVLPAIITIQILSVNSSMEFDLKNPKVIAAIICTLASFRLGLVWVVVSGVGSLVLLNYFM